MNKDVILGMEVNKILLHEDKMGMPLRPSKKGVSVVLLDVYDNKVKIVLDEDQISYLVYLMDHNNEKE